MIHPVFVERRMQNAPRAIAVTSGSRKSGVIASRWCGGGPVRLISLLLCYHTACLGASTRMGISYRFLQDKRTKRTRLCPVIYITQIPLQRLQSALPLMTIPNLPTNTGGAGVLPCRGFGGVPQLASPLSPLPRIGGDGGGSSLANMLGCSTRGLTLPCSPAIMAAGLLCPQSGNERISYR